MGGHNSSLAATMRGVSICLWKLSTDSLLVVHQVGRKLNLGRLHITIRLADLNNYAQIYLDRMCQEVLTDNKGKANSNPGWGVSIPCTYNIAGCPVSGIVDMSLKVHHFNLNPRKPNLEVEYPNNTP